MSSRPDRDQWQLDGAIWMSQMGDCTRRQVGAVIFGPDKRLWGAGYNGSYPGGPSCLEGACPRGRHYELTEEKLDGLPKLKHGWERAALRDLREDVKGYGGSMCACGEAWPCPDAVAPGSSYDTGPGACISSHAEANAVSDAQQRNGGRLVDCTMYVSCEPCEGCVRHVRNHTDIRAIIWPGGAIGLP